MVWTMSQAKASMNGPFRFWPRHHTSMRAVFSPGFSRPERSLTNTALRRRSAIKDASALIESLLPKVFEKDTSLQLETNLLDDGTGEAVVYLFIDEKVKKSFPNEELIENEVFSVYYELDEDGRAVSVTYSKAVDRENFKILQTVTITY